jgi:hypothetical protein
MVSENDMQHARDSSPGNGIAAIWRFNGRREPDRRTHPSPGTSGFFATQDGPHRHNTGNGAKRCCV